MTQLELDKLLKQAKQAGRDEVLRDGYVIVPAVPTYQMCAQALVACPVFGLSINAIPTMYEAMIAASAPEKGEK